MKPAFTFWKSLYEPVGRLVSMPWGDLADRVVGARAAASKDELQRWAPVEFRDDHRRLANVVRAHGVTLDVDQGAELAQVLAALEGLFAIVHSTFSATPAAPRWRIVVPVARPLDAEEYTRVWRWLAMPLEARSIAPDYNAKDASRAWAVPARPPSGYYIAEVLDGAFVDADLALEAIPKPEPLPERSAPMPDDYEQRRERARKYLESVPGAISGSQGHATTFRAAVILVRGFALEPDDALSILVSDYNPRCAPPWELHELRHKIRQALQRARQPFGFIADRGRAA